MAEWFKELSGLFQDNHCLQGAIAAFFSLFFEDVTAVASGLLVSTGNMSFLSALLGLIIGITSADTGLYCIGRFGNNFLRKRRLVKDSSLLRGKKWFVNNFISAVIVPRFIPGTRAPAYIAAGILKVSLLKFVVVDAIAVTVWVFTLLTLLDRFGSIFLDELGRYKWIAGACIVILVIAANVLIKKRFEKEEFIDRLS